MLFDTDIEKRGNIYCNSNDFRFPIKDDERPLFSGVIIGFIVNNNAVWRIGCMEDRMFNRLACVLSVLIVFLTFTASVFAQPFAYVANGSSDNVSVIDTATNTVIDTVPVGEDPNSVAIAPIIIEQNIPTLSQWGLIAMAGILGIVGFMVMRRRRVTV